MESSSKSNKPTMHDVAKMAGFSVSTVSHVFNNTASISEGTRRKVLDIAKELNYSPMRMKGPKAAAQNKLIGVLVPDIVNEFYARCAQEISLSAISSGYSTVLCDMRYNEAGIQKQINSLLERNVSGIIFFGGALDESIILNAKKHVPIVLGDRKIINKPISSVQTANATAMRSLVSSLKKWGYSKIGFVSESQIMSNVVDRYMGFRMGIEENGLPWLDEYIILSDELMLDKVRKSYEIFDDLLKSKKASSLPEVFVTSSDLIAIGVISALEDHGIKVPNDIGVTGFDDISLASHFQPALTTVAQDMQQLGKSCVESLHLLINSEHTNVQHIEIDARLIIRKSVIAADKP